MASIFSDVMGALKGAQKTQDNVSKGVYISLMIVAIIFIAIGAALLASSKFASGIILLLVGGGFGYLGYTMMPTKGGEESYYGADEDDDYF